MMLRYKKNKKKNKKYHLNKERLIKASIFITIRNSEVILIKKKIKKIKK
jgi:hypothetical protein